MPLLPPDFAILFDSSEPSLRLDLACLTLSRHFKPDLDVDTALAQLDQLADGLPEPTLDGLTRHLFDELGFGGNQTDYYDPRNSFLDEVMVRRTGIPITLSIVTIEVGRRAGTPLVGIGMPGHFLVRDQVHQNLFVDPFHRGTRLETADCERLFRRLQPDSVVFDPAMLSPVGSHDIITRVLTNLRHIFAGRHDLTSLATALRLLLCTPSPGAEVAAEAIGVFSAVGRFDHAADAADLAGRMVPHRADHYHAEATRLRARLN